MTVRRSRASLSLHLGLIACVGLLATSRTTLAANCNDTIPAPGLRITSNTEYRCDVTRPADVGTFEVTSTASSSSCTIDVSAAIGGTQVALGTKKSDGTSKFELAGSAATLTIAVSCSGAVDYITLTGLQELPLNPLQKQALSLQNQVEALSKQLGQGSISAATIRKEVEDYATQMRNHSLHLWHIQGMAHISSASITRASMSNPLKYATFDAALNLAKSRAKPLISEQMGTIAGTIGSVFKVALNATGFGEIVSAISGLSTLVVGALSGCVFSCKAERAALKAFNDSIAAMKADLNSVLSMNDRWTEIQKEAARHQESIRKDLSDVFQRLGILNADKAASLWLRGTSRSVPNFGQPTQADLVTVISKIASMPTAECSQVVNNYFDVLRQFETSVRGQPDFADSSDKKSWLAQAESVRNDFHLIRCTDEAAMLESKSPDCK